MAFTADIPGRQSSDNDPFGVIKVPLGWQNYHGDYNQGNAPVDTPDTPPPDGGGDGSLVMAAVTPNTGPANTVTAVVVTGVNLTLTKGNPTIGKSCHNTVVNDDSSLTTDTPGNQGPGTFPVVILLMDNVTQVFGPSFTYT
jgi:hypothetical protein